MSSDRAADRVRRARCASRIAVAAPTTSSAVSPFVASAAKKRPPARAVQIAVHDRADRAAPSSSADRSCPGEHAAQQLAGSRSSPRASPRKFAKIRSPSVVRIDSGMELHALTSEACGERSLGSRRPRSPRRRAAPPGNPRARRTASGSASPRSGDGTPSKTPGAVVLDRGRLAVHQTRRVVDCAAEVLSDRLAARDKRRTREGRPRPPSRCASSAVPASSGRPGPGPTHGAS